MKQVVPGSSLRFSEGIRKPVIGTKVIEIDEESQLKIKINRVINSNGKYSVYDLSIVIKVTIISRKRVMKRTQISRYRGSLSSFLGNRSTPSLSMCYVRENLDTCSGIFCEHVGEWRRQNIWRHVTA